MKRNKLYFLFSLMVLFLFGCKQNNPEEEFNVLYELNEDGNSYSICGYNGNKVIDNLTIEETYNNLPVTKINSQAFSYCKNVLNITLPNSITTIETEAFSNCINLESINIPQNVTLIEDKTFIRCKNLTEVFIQGNVEKIGVEAFSSCSSLPYVSLPDSVYDIKERAFSSCDNLIYFDVPEKVEIIKSKTFSDCESLMNVKFNEALQEIETGAFLNCSSLETVVLKENVKRLGESVFAGCKKLTTITLPFLGETIDDENTQTLSYVFGGSENVSKKLEKVTLTKATHISEKAFYDCEQIKSISLPQTLNTIGDLAFYNCKKLEELTIGGEITSIGIGVFGNCEALPYIYQDNGKYFGTINNPYLVLIDVIDKDVKDFDVNSETISIESKCFKECYQLTNLQISKNINRLSESLFEDLINLHYLSTPFIGSNKLDIDEGLEYLIGSNEQIKTTLSEVVVSECDYVSKNAFKDFVNLNTISYLNPVVNIYDNAFYNCESLKNLQIGDQTEIIGNLAFKNCKSLSDIKISRNLRSIGEYAFENCENIVKISFSDKIETIPIYAFSGCKKLEYVEVTNSLKSIGYGAFINCESLKEIPLGNFTNYIGSKAFYNCDSLEEIYIHNNISFIGYSVFSECENIIKYEVNQYNLFYDSRNNCNAIVETKSNELVAGCGNSIIDETITSIGQGAFKGSKINKVQISSNVEIIKYQAFENCEQLTEIDLTNAINLKTIEGYAFSLTCIQNITIPNNVVKINEGVFFGCKNLENVIFGELCNLVFIDDFMFASCENLKEINLPTTITSINQNAFNGCVSLIEISIPENVNSIGNFAFSRCKKLTQIAIPNSVIEIGEYCFSGCEQLEQLILSDNIKKVGKGFINRCNNLEYNTYDNALYLSSQNNKYYMLIKVIDYGKEHMVINNWCNIINEQSFSSYNKLKTLIIPQSVKLIGSDVFKYNETTKIYVESEAELEGWTEGWNNELKVCYYRNEKPVNNGDYWHYVQGEVVEW